MNDQQLLKDLDSLVVELSEKNDKKQIELLQSIRQSYSDLIKKNENNKSILTQNKNNAPPETNIGLPEYKKILENSGIAIFECDITSLNELLEAIRKQGVSDLILYLSEHKEISEQLIQFVDIYWINDEACKLFEVSDADMFRNNRPSFFTDNSTTILLEWFNYLYTGKSFLQAEVEYLSYRSNRILVNQTLNRFGNKVIVSMINSTARWTAEKSSKMHEQRFNHVFEYSPLGVIILDEKISPISINPAFSNMTGYTLDDLRSMDHLEITHPDDIEADEKGLQRLLANPRETHKLEKRYIRKDGSILHAKLTASCILDEKGIPIFGLSIIEDLSEQKQVGEELAAANNLKNDFLSRFSHTIRTPINTIIGFSQMLMDELKQSPNQLNLLRSIRNSGKELVYLMDDILDLTKIEIDTATITHRIFSLTDFMTDLQGVFTTQLKKQGGELHLNYNEFKGLNIRTDKARLRQILSILFNTLCTTISDKKLFIRVSLAKAHENFLKHNLSIEIKRKEDLPTTKNKPSSTLLSSNPENVLSANIAVAIKLANLLNGSITEIAHGHEKYGFSLIINNVDIDYYSTSTSSIQAGISIQQGKILVVDDDEQNRLIIKGLLRRQAVEVILAEGGQEALYLLKDELIQPDVMLLDWQMEPVNGEMVLQKMEELGINNIPVVIMSAGYASEIKQMPYLSIKKWMPKPIEKDRLLQTLSEFLPYNEQENNASETIETSSSTILANELTPETKERLQNYFIQLYNQLAFTFSFNSIKNFVDELAEFATENNSIVIQEFCSEVRSFHKQYEIENAKKALARFPVLVATINK